MMSGSIADALPGVRTSGRFASAIEGANLAGKALHKLAQSGAAAPAGAGRSRKTVARCCRHRRRVGRCGGRAARGEAGQSRYSRGGSRGRPSPPGSAPMCPCALQNAPAFMRGIGEIVEPMAQLPRLDVVLVNPLVPVPANKTARVFKYLNAPPLGPERRATGIGWHCVQPRCATRSHAPDRQRSPGAGVRGHAGYGRRDVGSGEGAGRRDGSDVRCRADVFCRLCRPAPHAARRRRRTT